MPDRDPAAWCRAWREVYVPLLMGDPSGFERMSVALRSAQRGARHVAEAMVAVFAELRDYDWRPALADLRVPVLVLHGEEDREPLDSAYEWAAAVADGQVLVLPGWASCPGSSVPSACSSRSSGSWDDAPGARRRRQWLRTSTTRRGGSLRVSTRKSTRSARPIAQRDTASKSDARTTSTTVPPVPSTRSGPS